MEIIKFLESNQWLEKYTYFNVIRITTQVISTARFSPAGRGGHGRGSRRSQTKTRGPPSAGFAARERTRCRCRASEQALNQPGLSGGLLSGFASRHRTAGGMTLLTAEPTEPNQASGSLRASPAEEVECQYCKG